MESGTGALVGLLKDQLTLTSLLSIGAAMQALLFALPVPFHYKVTPLVLIILHQVITTWLPALGYTENPYVENVIASKVSAQLPERESGFFHDKPAAEPLVVFLLGVQFNHPLGIFAPGVRETGEWFTKNNQALNAEPDKHGLLGSSSWRGTSRSDKNGIISLYYFRDLGGLHRFAHGKTHREGWDWYAQVVRKNGWKHIGINHEVFTVPKGGYETIYDSCTPTMMGGISIKTNASEGSGMSGQDWQWQRTLVDARKGPMRNQYGRMAKSEVDTEVNIMA